MEIRLLEGGSRPKRQRAQQALELQEPTKPSAAAPAAATQQAQWQPQQHEQAEEQEELGPSSWARQGPPRPAASTPIAPEGGWATLYAQLQARRAELSGGKGQAADVPSHPLASLSEGTPEQQRQANGTVVASGSGGPGRGASRPRGGVRQTALGPMLAVLRRGGVFGGSGGESS